MNRKQAIPLLLLLLAVLVYLSVVVARTHQRDIIQPKAMVQKEADRRVEDTNMQSIFNSGFSLGVAAGMRIYEKALLGSNQWEILRVEQSNAWYKFDSAVNK